MRIKCAYYTHICWVSAKTSAGESLKKASKMSLFGALKLAFERGYFVTRRGAHYCYYIETAIHFASLHRSLLSMNSNGTNWRLYRTSATSPRTRTYPRPLPESRRAILTTKRLHTESSYSNDVFRPMTRKTIVRKALKCGFLTIVDSHAP